MAAEPMRELELLNRAPSTDCAARTFEVIKEHLSSVKDSIEIHMFVWRSDNIGNEVAVALLAAAERGVRFHLRKDVGAVMYERIEMNRQSLFEVPVPFIKRAYYRLIRPTFPDTYQPDERDGRFGKVLMDHPNGSIEWVDHTHSKYYVFDEHTLITGSINVEDRHFGYFDYMIRITGKHHVERFRSRMRGDSQIDRNRPIEFVFNRRNPQEPHNFEIKPLLLELLRGASAAIYMEMAYLGDPDVTEALIDAADRKVEVTILTSQKANVGNDLNFRTIHEIFDRCNAKIYLSPAMVHAKLTLIDDHTAFFGSANASVFSMQKAVEMNVLINDDTTFINELKRLIMRRLEASIRIKEKSGLPSFRSWLAALQQFHQVQSK